VLGCGGSGFSDAGLGAISAIYDFVELQDLREILNLKELPEMKGF